MLGLKNTLWNTVTGMNTSKAALSTVGHNIANANTEGYSRQQVTIGARAPVKVFTGSEQISQAGQGAQLTNIERAHSSFLERQLLRDRLNRGFFDGQRRPCKYTSGFSRRGFQIPSVRVLIRFSISCAN